MNGRVLAGGLILFSLAFGAALWWFQTRGHYDVISGVDAITVNGATVAVDGYRGIDGASSPLKLRGCFQADGLDGPRSEDADPLVAPGWFDCYDAKAIAGDIRSGAATAILAESTRALRFDRIVASYSGRPRFEWRQINPCGAAHFAGDPLPPGARKRTEPCPDLLARGFFPRRSPPACRRGRPRILKRLVTDGLVAQGLTYAAAAAFATPRRLALSVTGLPKASPDVREERKGPRVDAPEAALAGFLRSTGLDREQLTTREDKKGAVWFAEIEKPGAPGRRRRCRTDPRGDPRLSLAALERWGSGDLRWIRPLQSIMCVLYDDAGTEIVPFESAASPAAARRAGIASWRRPRSPPNGFDDYVRRLGDARVVLDAEDRAARIRADMETLAFARGLEVVPDEGLLREVAGLVEWPVTLMGEIEDRFLCLPPESAAHLDERASEILLRPQSEDRTDRELRDRRQCRDAGSGRDGSGGQPARACGAVVGRALLLGERPSRRHVRRRT